MIEKAPDVHTAPSEALYIAMDLAKKSWALALADRSSRKPTTTSVTAYCFEELDHVVMRAKRRFGLDKDATVVCCQEAGRDGFAVHRFLERHGFVSLVVDAASIETSRKKRQAKTDRLDACKLVRKLRSYVLGDADVFSVCRVPSEEAEDMRRIVRERIRLVSERTQHRTRIKCLLAAVGITLKVDDSLVATLKEARTSAGSLIGPHLRREILRELERLELVQCQIDEVMAEMNEAVATPTTLADEQASTLIDLMGVGLITAVTLSREFFSWRAFRNRKEVGAAAGLAPTPSQTGESLDADLGISKSGNVRVRTLMIEISWGWLRNQPHSRQTRWFNERLANNSKRSKRTLIVAVARRLLVELWRFVNDGIVPDGARLAASAT